jgi:hypothetical protein
MWGCRLNLYGAEQRSVVGYYEYGNESSGTVKGREFSHHFIGYGFPKRPLLPGIFYGTENTFCLHFVIVVRFPV